MKLITALMLMLALGLSVAYAQEFEDAAVDLAELEDDEIVDMDDALEKYRMLKDLARIVARGEAMDLINPQKRFIGSVFNKMKEAIKEAADKVGDFFTKKWNEAKNTFDEVAHGEIDFKATLEKAKKYIHSGMSVAACKAAIAAAAGVVLGPAASLVGVAAGPLCDAGLAELEKVAG